MSTKPELLAYAIEPEDLAKLKTISDRLYDGTTLSYDERRELAFVVKRIVDDAVPLHDGDEMEGFGLEHQQLQDL